MLLRRARPLLGAISAVAVQQRCAARAHESENASVVERTTRAAPRANPVTQNEQYIKGIKLYDIGILELREGRFGEHFERFAGRI